MSRKLSVWLAILLAMVLLAAVWLSVSGLAAPASPSPAAPTVQPGDDSLPRRERPDVADAPNISFIDDPTVQCIRPEQHTDACYVQWQYMQVTASSSQYIISMTVSISDRIRGTFSGFFQTFMTVPQPMLSPGFRVACGTPGSGAVPGLGNTYSWVVRAKETGGLSAANYGSVTCPADVVPASSVHITGPSSGLVTHPYTFTAQISPITTTLPVTYAWTATGQTPVTVTHNLTDTQTFTWTVPGVQEMEVKVIHAVGVITATHSITITTPTPPPTPTPSPTPPGTHLYLPAIKGARPPADVRAEGPAAASTSVPGPLERLARWLSDRF